MNAKFLIFILIFLVSFLTVVSMFQDGAGILPEWVQAYNLYFFLGWAVLMIFGFLELR